MSKAAIPIAGEPSLVERLKMNAEMMADGWQGPTLTDLWHSDVVREAAKDAAEAAIVITELLDALGEASGVLSNIPAPHSFPLWTRMLNAIRKADAAIARATGAQ